MQPHESAVCFSEVQHHRMFPTRHSFTNKMTQIWIDPDKPQELFDQHYFWSTTHLAPARFKRKDYFDNDTDSLTTALKKLVAERLGLNEVSSVRMVTQPRMWGWLFNPLTIYFLWDKQDQLCAAVLEVTNTPWKQRHFYCCELTYDKEKDRWQADFEKKLHVSPFLTSNYHYDFTVKEQGPTIVMLLNVANEENAGKPILRTVLKVQRQKPTRQILSKALRRNAFATHRTSFGIHYQAAKLWFKKVPFVAYSSNKKSKSVS